MPRLILLILLVGAGWWLIRKLRQQLGRSGREPNHPGTNKQPEQGEKLVACEECGVHLPVSEATQLHQPGSQGSDIRYFCGREHQITWQQHHHD